MAGLETRELDQLREELRSADSVDQMNLTRYRMNEGELRGILGTFKELLVDPTFPSERFLYLFNTPRPTTVTKTAESANSALPPKLRAKASRIPAIPQDATRAISPDFKLKNFPLLPKMADQKRLYSQLPFSGELGAVVAVIHPSIGPPRFCRVLASKKVNGTWFYLCSFFQGGQSPCYVTADHIFEIKKKASRLFDDPKESAEYLTTRPHTVDSLLEPIFGNAQSLVYQMTSALFPSPTEGQYTPTHEQKEAVKAQCTQYAALFLLLELVTTYDLPKDKFKLMVSTFLKIGPPKYPETSQYVSRCVDLMDKLYDIIHLSGTK